MSRSATFHDFCNPTAAEEAAFLQNARLGRVFRDLPSTPEDELPPEDESESENGHRRRGILPSSTFSSWLQLLMSKKRRSIMSFSQRPPFMRPSISLSVVHETSALGSDGESIEVSPCTSDQMSTSSQGHSSSGTNGDSAQGSHQQRYIPNVKLRQKPNNRRWSEQDIQKRLSLPADIKLPQNVVEKLNRTPTLDNPLTRKSRRASLSEIGFGKLETYKKMFDLGEGTYATVYLGESLLTGKPVALKEIRLEHDEGAPCTAIREVSLLRNLKHANVVTLHDIIYTNRILTLVFEYVEHDLRDYMEEVDNMIVLNNVKLFLMQLLRGLAYCHQRRVLHRDLKPQNLLINNNGELKLADFGLARAQSVPTKTYSNEVVTLWYRPPDVLLGSKEYSSHIDMWGVGCILFEMLTRKAMFPGSTTDEQLNLIFQRLGVPTQERSASLLESPYFKQLNLPPCKPKPLMKLSPRIDAQSADLLEKFLKYEGRTRISAADAMRHPFLGNFPSAVFSLGDNESILSVPGVRYVPETFVHTRNMSMVHSSASMNGFSNQPKQHFQKHT
uniref:cyclin-dependent kinase n=1 Tax=Panagrellus redivivus TaxID=6233 RepID=A0A7E4W8L4_PANRE